MSGADRTPGLPQRPSQTHLRRASYVGPYVGGLNDEGEFFSPAGSGSGSPQERRGSAAHLLSSRSGQFQPLEGISFNVDKCNGRTRNISSAARKATSPVLKQNKRLLHVNPSTGVLTIRKKGKSATMKSNGNGSAREETHAIETYVVCKDRTDPRRVMIRTNVDSLDDADGRAGSAGSFGDGRSSHRSPVDHRRLSAALMNSDSDMDSDFDGQPRASRAESAGSTPGGHARRGSAISPADKPRSTTVVKKEKLKERKYQFSSPADREHFLHLVNKWWIYPPLASQLFTKDGEADDMAAEALHHVWREFLYQAHTPLLVQVCTWNMGNAAPPTEGLAALFGEDKDDVHIFAIGIQECDYDPRYGYSNSEADMHGVIMSSIGGTHKRVANVGLYVGKRLLSQVAVYVRRDIERFVTNIETSSEATGIGHVVGNKGGMAISFSVQETNLCFINSHLAAHQEKFEERNNNYVEIVKGIRLGTRNVQVTEQFHHLFWFGDLNYRIDLPFEEAVALARKRDFKALLAQDQLRREMLKEKVLVNFREGIINFPPTYRYERGSCEYGTTKMRVPSYCDRILWRSMPGYITQSHMYTSVDSVLTSDHHPVVGRYTCTVAPPTLCAMHQNECYFGLFNVAATGLHGRDINGASDPFLVVHGPFLEHAYRSRAILRNVNPEWKDEDIPIMKPYLTNRADLYSMAFAVTVLDFDMATANDRLGHVNIAASSMVEKGHMHFNLQIMSNGLPAGMIRGEARLAYKGDPFFNIMRDRYLAEIEARGAKKHQHRLKDLMRGGPANQCSIS